MDCIDKTWIDKTWINKTWIDKTCIFDQIRRKHDIGAVYMTPERLSRRSEFTLVPSHGSTFT